MNAKNCNKAKTLVLVLVSFLINICLAVDLIKANESLTGDQTLITANGLFELGFFNTGNSSNYYIGIWYKTISVRTVVWVANRDKPVTDKYSSTLKISDEGNLVLVSNMSKSPIWSTSLTSNLPNTTEAILLDKGNLVLRGASNSTAPLWQSFDYPTDTLIPGGKLGFDKKTGINRVLTSWVDSENPATGYYTLECDPDSKQLVLVWKKSKKYWNSGVWITEQRIFTQVPELLHLPPGYRFEYVDNKDETYVKFDVSEPSLILVRLAMDETGQMRSSLWSNDTQEWIVYWSKPEQICNVHASCGAFSICNQNSQPYCNCLTGFKPKVTNEWDLGAYSRGCTRKTKLNCENPSGGTHRDKFVVSSMMVFPDASRFVSPSSSDKCKEVCLRNCSCSAYAYTNEGCSIWFGDLLNVKQVSSSDASGKTLYIRLAASELQTRRNKKLTVGISVGLSVGVILALCVVFVAFSMKKNRSITAARSVGSSLTRFEYRDLRYATKNFSQRLGRGGFGSVFKGTMPDSTVIAVKKLEKTDHEYGEKQFRAEVSTIATIQHVNLVRLYGFCSERTKRVLVYEYMPNGSLDTHLFRREGSEVLSWKVRYQIAIGIAKGLTYLHEKCRECIIHCDIKPENILLDAEFCAKVADFGLAKLLGREFSRVLTTIRGTRGYLAPEWISGEAITVKVDVYSYGMVLFELISGRRNVQQIIDGKVNRYYPYWALMKITQGEDVLSIVDPRLGGNVEIDEVLRMSKLACWCIQDEIDRRPSMGQVVQVLEGILVIDMPSLPRSLDFLIDDDDGV